MNQPAELMTYVDAAKIARIAHEVNRAYCRAIGDDSQKVWHETPQNLQDSVVEGVRFRLANPGISPEAQHEAWLQYKKQEGWILGAKKDVEKRTHPNIRPYAELPPEQKVKDHLFATVVDLMLGRTIE